MAAAEQPLPPRWRRTLLILGVVLLLGFIACSWLGSVAQVKLESDMERLISEYVQSERTTHGPHMEFFSKYPREALDALVRRMEREPTRFHVHHALWVEIGAACSRIGRPLPQTPDLMSAIQASRYPKDPVRTIAEWWSRSRAMVPSGVFRYAISGDFWTAGVP